MPLQGWEGIELQSRQKSRGFLRRPMFTLLGSYCWRFSLAELLQSTLHRRALKSRKRSRRWISPSG
uniref:Uncharacterized protein n=1 Tax=Rhizophora mucronata TaxID=61149 RepID=A0A2P2IIW4_RHIMU